MSNINKEEIFNLSSFDQFEHLALSVFRKQAIENPVFNNYLSNLGCKPSLVKKIDEIPFLPIELFKTQKVLLNDLKSEIIFTSSGTTGMQQSKHYVSDITYYERSYRQAFNFFYGNIQEMALVALLPSYLERDGSSLIYMVDDLIKQANPSYSGYFLHNHHDLWQRLNELHLNGIPTILIGVTYALLDFVEKYPIQFPDLIVMETGGMKGKRREMVREELHKILCNGFGVENVHSEYGMTELLSQAYSKGKGIFFCPPWMKILVRDINDPFAILPTNRNGGINVIDLANINSCSFIATQDLGMINDDGSFTIIGRFDQSDIRGCNLLVQ
ncbi:LuxE/PaaK family acyltransferase [Olivibacter domesticus]|uniref:Acyl-protein synthetase, LuxE n=1 Tax=Olivibacter domesticus TaxID=407022 RepID=A0A1H7LBM2_OLID1|nr:acyl transferase [Olivibacter domesticus]SEK96383.1 Acyl-protein synthetase, LuxE [Olivibacter domesticus]